MTSRRKEIIGSVAEIVIIFVVSIAIPAAITWMFSTYEIDLAQFVELNQKGGGTAIAPIGILQFASACSILLGFILCSFHTRKLVRFIRTSSISTKAKE